MKSPGRIRVLHLLTSLAPGGAETNLLSLVRHFDFDRYEHAVGYGGGGVLEAEFGKAGVPRIRISEAPLSLRGLFSVRDMVERIDAWHPDIIHSHLDLPNVVGLAAQRKTGCKLILHFHGLGIIPRAELPGRNATHWLWNGIARSYRRCDHAIAICRYQLPFLERLGIGSGKISLIPNGISLVDRKKGNPSSSRFFRFVNVARFFPEKDHDLLIRAFSKVSRDIPLARLVLVGDGPLRHEIVESVRTLGLAGEVEFLGVRRDVPDILDSCHCFVLSSRWELHPITILEAMRAALPVVAMNVGGVPDTVEDGVSGLLVRPGDVSGLQEAMHSLASRPEKATEMGNQGFRMVYDRFSNDSVARQIEEVYAKVPMTESA